MSIELNDYQNRRTLALSTHAAYIAGDNSESIDESARESLEKLNQEGWARVHEHTHEGTGAGFIVLRNEATNETIVSFTGTQSNDAQDAHADITYLGLNQSLLPS